jgi:uncharacterized membrane protein
MKFVPLPDYIKLSGPEDFMPGASIEQHVELIARHEQDFLNQRTTSQRIGDVIAGFAGSLKFVGIHLAIFGTWITLNLWPGRKHFDPPPFSLLSNSVTLEAILLASFILIRQGRIGRRADEREHLMLQVLLLTEKEMTAMMELNRQIAKQIGLKEAADQPDIEELSHNTSIDRMAQTIRENLPPSE